MARGPAKEKAIALAPATAAHSNNEIDDLVRKRDSFVTSMTMLRNAAEEASHAGLAYFNHIIGTAPNGDHAYTYQRGISMPPRAITEEPEAAQKRTRRKREKRDPDLPKRPMTAYLLFCNHGREAVKNDLGENATHKEIIAELTRRWAQVTEDEKKGWQDEYQKNRAVYDKDLAEYKASKDPHPVANIAPATTLAIAPATAAPASGFTAVNHTEAAGDTDIDSEPEHEDEPAPPTAKAPEPELEPESELSSAEEPEDEDEEAEKSPSPPPKSPTPPLKTRATPRGKKAAANGKKTAVAAPPSPPKEKAKRKRTSSRKKAAAEEEAVVAEETPKKRTKKRRKSSGD